MCLFKLIYMRRQRRLPEDLLSPNNRKKSFVGVSFFVSSSSPRGEREHRTRNKLTSPLLRTQLSKVPSPAPGVGRNRASHVSPAAKVRAS